MMLLKQQKIRVPISGPSRQCHTYNEIDGNVFKLLLLLSLYVLHILLHVFLETVLPGLGGPDLETVGVVEPQASGDIALAFDVLVPLSGLAIGGDTLGYPSFFAFPNIDYYPSSSSSVEVLGKESVYSPIGVRSNYGLRSIFSNPGLHQNKSLEPGHNMPNPGHNNGSDTNAPSQGRHHQPFQKNKSTSISGTTYTPFASGIATTSGGPLNPMGGREIPIPIFTPAIVGIGTTITNRQKDCPQK